MDNKSFLICGLEIRVENTFIFCELRYNSCSFTFLFTLLDFETFYLNLWFDEALARATQPSEKIPSERRHGQPNHLIIAPCGLENCLILIHVKAEGKKSFLVWCENFSFPSQRPNFVAAFYFILLCFHMRTGIGII